MIEFGYIRILDPETNDLDHYELIWRGKRSSAGFVSGFWMDKLTAVIKDEELVDFLHGRSLSYIFYSFRVVSFDLKLRWSNDVFGYSFHQEGDFEGQVRYHFRFNSRNLDSVLTLDHYREEIKKALEDRGVIGIYPSIVDWKGEESDSLSLGDVVSVAFSLNDQTSKVGEILDRHQPILMKIENVATRELTLRYANIRRLLKDSLVEYFSYDELRSFSWENFNEVHKLWDGSGISKETYALKIVEHCYQRKAIDILMTLILVVRPSLSSVIRF